MNKKIVLFGNKDTGKSSTLKALVYLMTRNQNVLTDVIYNGVYYPQMNNSVNTLFTKRSDLRIIFTYISPKGTETKVAISTQGDDANLVELNWDMFLQRKNGSVKVKQTNTIPWERLIPSLGVSPCHCLDSSRDQEEFEQHKYNKSLEYILWMKVDAMSLWNKAIDKTSLSEEIEKEYQCMRVDIQKGIDVFYSQKRNQDKECTEKFKCNIYKALIIKSIIDDII